MKASHFVVFFLFLEIFIAQTKCTVCRVCTVCTRISYKTFPVTNLNKYLHYDTSGTE